MADISILALPVEVGGEIQVVSYDIKDAVARERISELGKALYWIGVTTTALTDGATTNPITVGGESVTAKAGGVAQYDGEEFAFDGTNWQKLGEGNLGALAYKNSAEGTYTPAGSVNVVKGNDTTANVTPFGTAGSLPSWSVSGETATFGAGTLPTAGTPVAVVTESGTDTATFTGTQGNITVS